MDVLKFMNEQMGILEIPYNFGEWTEEIKYPYFVGECTEDEAITEDGLEQFIFLLNGFNRGDYATLESAKEKIKEHFDPIGGLRVQTESGSIVAFFDGAFYVPTNEAELKRIQINITIKHWKGRN